jgi:hypothetical protein
VVVIRSEPDVVREFDVVVPGADRPERTWPVAAHERDSRATGLGRLSSEDDERTEPRSWPLRLGRLYREAGSDAATARRRAAAAVEAPEDEEPAVEAAEVEPVIEASEVEPVVDGGEEHRPRPEQPQEPGGLLAELPGGPHRHVGAGENEEPPRAMRPGATPSPGRPPRRSRLRSWLVWSWLVVLLACGGAVAVLSGQEQDARGPRLGIKARRIAISPECRGAWTSAAGAAPADRTRADLDAAIGACRSLGEWRRAARSYPRALEGADPLRHLGARCRAAREALAHTPLCKSTAG